MTNQIPSPFPDFHIHTRTATRIVLHINSFSDGAILNEDRWTDYECTLNDFAIQEGQCNFLNNI